MTATTTDGRCVYCDEPVSRVARTRLAEAIDTLRRLA